MSTVVVFVVIVVLGSAIAALYGADDI